MGIEGGGTSGTPPQRRVIRLFPDYGRDWPLWEDSTATWDVGYTTEPQMYGLSERLTQAIWEWNRFWEGHFHHEDGWETASHREQWRIQGERIAKWLRSEVREFADVAYEPWPLGS